MTETGPDDGVDFPIHRTCPYTPPEEYRSMLDTERPTAGRLYNGKRVWLVSRYDQARAVLGNTRFSSDITHPGYPIYAEAIEGFRAFPLLNTMDPPLHSTLRRAVVSEFTLRRAESLRPAMQRMADELVDAMMSEGNSADLVTHFAEPFAGTVTCWSLGMEYTDLQKWLLRSQGIREKPASAVDTEQVGAQIIAQILALQQYFQGFVDAKQENPGDDPISRVVEKYVNTGALTKDELVKLCFVIFVAGQSPVKAMITIGVMRLLEQPEQAAAVRENPDALPAAVDELTRLISPLDLMPRVALEDIEVGGQLIREGEGVLVAGGAANRDPGEYPDPDQLDVRREARGHLAFGSGVHHCLGANLTKVGLEVVYGTLLRRLPGLKLALPVEEIYDRPSWHPEIERMPVTW